MQMSLRIAECKSANQWNEFAQTHGTVHHLYEWAHVNKDTFGSKCVNLGAWDGNRLVAIYPYIVRGRWPIRWFVSPTDFGGGPIGDPEAVKALIQEVESRARRQMITMNVVRYGDEEIGHFDHLAYKVSERHNLIVDLNRPQEEIWRWFPSKLRNSIKNSQKQNLDVSEGTVADLDIYFQLVRKHSAEVGYRPRSERFVRALFKYLDATLLLVRWEGNIVGGCVYLNFKKRASAINAARDPEQTKLRIGEANHWGGISYYCEKGYLEYDFMSRNDNEVVAGETRVFPSHASLHRFKFLWRPKEAKNVDLERIYHQSGVKARRLVARLRDRLLQTKRRIQSSED